MYAYLLHNFKSGLVQFNTNTYLAGIAMIMFNIGSRYLVVDMNKNTENILKSKVMRRITLFSIFFIATRDLIVSFILTAIFLIMTMNLLNEESKFCILPQSFKDNVFTHEEYDFSKKIIKEYEIMNKIEHTKQFCNIK
tara:strand:- start:626 stop:1039 length:414 start_codon:yes stop_codon:yes gene_type:complete